MAVGYGDLSPVTFEAAGPGRAVPHRVLLIVPRNGQPIRVVNLLTGTALETLLPTMVNVFVNFAPSVPRVHAL